MRKGGTTSVQILSAQAIANGPPGSASAGADLGQLMQSSRAVSGSLIVSATNTTLTLTVDARLWMYEPHSDEWIPIGVGAGGTKGIINNGTQLTETGANKIVHAEPLDLWRHFTRGYLQLTTTPPGATVSVSAWIVASDGR